MGASWRDVPNREATKWSEYAAFGRSCKAERTWKQMFRCDQKFGRPSLRACLMKRAPWRGTTAVCASIEQSHRAAQILTRRGAESECLRPHRTGCREVRQQIQRTISGRSPAECGSTVRGSRSIKQAQKHWRSGCRIPAPQPRPTASVRPFRVARLQRRQPRAKPPKWSNLS